MTTFACRTDLTAVPAGGHAPAGSVIYRSEGRILIVADDGADAAAAAARALAAARPTMLVVPGDDTAEGPDHTGPGDTRPAGPAGSGLFLHRGRVVALSGHLGAFRARMSTGEEVAADVVIDHGATPLLAAEVPAFGYLATRGDRAALEAATARAQALEGLFHKPRYFQYTLEICAHENAGQTGCTRCLDVCGAAAIRSVGWGVEVDPYLCQGCGACTLACPTGALSPAEPGRAALVTALEAAVAAAPGRRLEVGPPGSGAGLEVPAPAAFGEELWLAAMAAGAGGVTLYLGAAEPPATRTLVAGRIAEADAAMVALGHPSGTIRLALATPDGADRRADGPAASPVRPVSGTPEPAAAVRKRDVLNRALVRLERSPDRAAAPLAPGAPIGAIAIDPSACVLCGICSRLCPTASVGQDESSEDARILFAEGNCIQCGLCARLCPERAITLVPRLAPAVVRSQWRLLNAAAMAACIDCGVRFTPEPLLAAMLRRAGPDAVPEMLDGIRRCAQCRHTGAAIRS